LVVRDVCAEKLFRVVGLHQSLGVDELVLIADGLWKKYTEALPLGASLAATERQYGDDYVLLVLHLLMDCFGQSSNRIYIFHAILVLESALEKSTYNFQFKLLLIRLYALIGTFTLTVPVISSLVYRSIRKADGTV
jgi:N-terminal acetyltransferase B complex non-catalytic subunit